jgi:hypothetical protein
MPAMVLGQVSGCLLLSLVYKEARGGEDPGKGRVEMRQDPKSARSQILVSGSRTNRSMGRKSRDQSGGSP